MKLKIMVLFVFTSLLSITLHSSVVIASVPIMIKIDSCGIGYSGNKVVWSDDFLNKVYQAKYDDQMELLSEMEKLYNVNDRDAVNSMCFSRRGLWYGSGATLLKQGIKGTLLHIFRERPNWSIIRPYGDHRSYYVHNSNLVVIGAQKEGFEYVMSSKTGANNETEVENLKAELRKNNVLHAKYKIEIKNLETEINDREKEYLRVINELNKLNDKHGKEISSLKNRIALISTERDAAMKWHSEEHGKALKLLNDPNKALHTKLKKQRLVVVIMFIITSVCLLFALFAAAKFPRKKRE